MGERVYPRDSPPFSGEHPNPHSTDETPPVSGEHHRRMSQDSFASSKMSYGNGYGYGPNPGTYVVQVPKDRVFRVPPPENEHKFKLYTKKKSNRSCCRCCICSIISTILILILLLAITFGILYLVYHPKKPTYNITSVHVKGVNLTTSNADATTITPVFNVTVKINNPNGKIGIYYEQGSEVSVYRDGVNLCEGKLPAFYQPPNSVTVLSTELSGAGMVLSKAARDKLMNQQKDGKVPLEMDASIPVKVKLGSVKFWTFTVKVTCDVTLSALTANAKVVSKNCKVHATPW
ncbi:NDR1/HIN1-like protein 13 [Silene latifolia]|uniref:NDR1/HIN1-like protein 13 n=1 Tax=Silene latifolia TaxID=37657 RepID=UPI003D778C28